MTGFSSGESWCEPEDDIDIPVPRGSTIARCIAIVALARKLLIGLSRYVTHSETRVSAKGTVAGCTTPI